MDFTQTTKQIAVLRRKRRTCLWALATLRFGGGWMVGSTLRSGVKLTQPWWCFWNDSPCTSAIIFRFGIILALLTNVCAVSAAQETGQAKTSPVKADRENAVASTTAQGRREFVKYCSGCHGLDGRGGEHAPDIATSPTSRQLARDALFKIVRDGIPAKGMPGFAYLGRDTLNLVTDYLRRLGGQVSRISLHGNSSAGEALFFGKAECAKCHMMRSKGGFLGPDLTEYTQTHALQALRDAILAPCQNCQHTSEVVEVLTIRGERISGVIRNEDNFSLQLLARDGAFLLVTKSEIARLYHSGTAIMPENYAQRLTTQELEDLLAYLFQNAHPSATRSPLPLRSRGQISRDAWDHRR
jgi:cytochrome c oxidase cbb3-type subunit III